MPKNAVKTRFEGVFSITSSCRKHEGKPDICYYYVIKVDGKRKWNKAGWRSEGYTAAMAHELRSTHVQGLRHGSAIPTRKGQGQGLLFSAAFAAYDARHLANMNSGKMVRCYVRKHLLPLFGDRSMASINALEVEAFRQQLVAKGLSPRTIVHLLSYLHGIFKQTAAWGLHTLPSPVVGVKRPRIDNARMHYLTHAEADALLTDLKQRSTTWHDIAAVSLTTGARLSEVRTLTAGKVNLSGGVMEVNGKTGRRMVQLSDVAAALLQPRIENKRTDALVFPSSTGGLVSISGASFKRAVIACKLNTPDTPPLQRIVFHSLRHTFASWLAIAGVPIFTISELMGHKSLEMTRRYSHLCPDQKKAAVEVASKSLQHIILSS